MNNPFIIHYLPTQPVYNGEGNTIQGGANLTTLPGVSSKVASQTFDEPLSKEQVLAIASVFIRK